MKPAGITGIKGGTIWKTKLMNFQRTVRTRTLRDVHRRINQFQRGYQPVGNLVKDENGDLLADSHILNS
jgi:hypothetical protein